ncbi:hypothetical protein [Dietzia papillomatosis]|uniref:hypothetical protein n=1 Tax=Dietzia papillomatosis TaxID=282305 RepID=UPI000B0C65EA|nr:hypothetical protein [Dietzia papillomatosis]
MSDFEYVGDWNNQWNFKEKSTGMAYTYGRFDDDSFELDTGDRLIVTQANSTRFVWSFKENRVVEHLY